MKLRSGRVLNPMPFKHKIDGKAISNMVKQMENLKLEEKDETENVKKPNIFFRFLFYECCEDFGNKVRLEEIERVQGRKPNLYELINWKVDASFWQTTFQKALYRMRCELPLSTLLQAFDVFIKYEHGPEEPECFELKPVLQNYLHELYNNNCSTKIIKLMQEINHVKSHAFPVSDKKIYLQALASDIASQTIYPLFSNQPNIISWDKLFQYSKSRCRYIPEVDGGRTVVKLPRMVCNFSAFSSPSYQFKILKTGETFTSPESDIRKAFLLHKSCSEK